MAPTLSSFRANFFPPKPNFTDRDVSDLKGKVFLVSGANSGIGKELARILYAKNAKVYITARSEDKASKTIRDIKDSCPESSGELASLLLDLSDLSTIKASASRFLEAEDKLHVLFNNAGVMASSSNTEKTAQGYELQLGVNALGTFLFTKLLTPKLVATAKTEPAGSVRVVWLSSFSTELFAEKDNVFQFDNLDYHVDKSGFYKYGISKAGVWAYGVEFAKRYKASGVISVPLNPGNLRSELFRSQGLLMQVSNAFMLYPVINGAYTELYAGLSPAITMDHSGEWVIPFGRHYEIRKDLMQATKTVAEGGNESVQKFWEWSEEQVAPFV
ncbi:NAD(P)-binding domain protein [Metarhizium rileyi]|uniref:NAD(P)-binding domain protein n=1 Tax=Metarhizium rileyi (strain RCEF 4871) TaxID=1649241 RepID=A0A162J5K3_METRR|nr:NAD(P)-binding domain protein [Metarhizium rileyi RCEF 4871]